MAANEYKIFQAYIKSKDAINPRQYTVIRIPEGTPLSKVQLPNALKDQSAPLVGSVVLVLQLDSYRSYILSVLREPYGVLDGNDQYRGFITSTGNFTVDASIGANPIQDGEIFMEATGPESPTGQVVPGFGAHLYLGNNGCAQIESGSMAERIIIGGEGSDDDHEVILSADNGYFESNTGTDNIQSTFNYTTNATTGLTEGLQVATQLSVPNLGTNLTTETTIAELNIDTLANVTLRSTVVGTGLTAGSLTMDALSNVTLASSVSGVPQATINLYSTGVVNLNSGTSFAARISDTVTSTATTDLQYWLFINAIQSFFTVLASFAGGNPVLQSQLGTLGQAFLALSPSAPTSLTSTITSGSKSVLIG